MRLKDYKYYLAVPCYVALSALMFLGMGTGGESVSGPLEPSFMPLEEGEPSFSGTIRDGATSFKVRDISFSGKTKLGMLRLESDDSSTNISLEKHNRIEINKHNFNSERYADKEFTLVSVTNRSGHTTKDILMPRKIVVCAVESKSDMEKAWFINKLDKIEIDKLTPVEPGKPSDKKEKGKDPATGAPVVPEQESLLDKAKEAGQAAVDMVKKTGEAIYSAVKSGAKYIGVGNNEREKKGEAVAPAG